jgi:filamentous hemagglutinin family protein
VLGASLAALAAQAADPRPLGPGWFAARSGAGSTTAPAATPQAAAAAVSQSLANMRQAAQAVAAMQAVQTQARSAAAALNFGTGQVGNGLGAGALQPLNPGSWQNASAPVPSTNAAGRTQVTVTQTAQQAVLTWSSFNVGAQTDLVFDQSAGGSSANTWVALNRVTDPSAQPSQILGSIRAPGQVYVINRNGIIFGAGSQVNVGALLASTADFAGGGTGFPANGIYSVAGTAGLLPAFGGSSGTDAPAGSAVVVQAGAQITTSAPASALNGGGFVMLLGANVQNAGAISTPQGQTVLAAGQRFILQPGYSSSGGGDALGTTLGSEIAVTGGGSAANTGLIQADQGDITLVGHAVTQAGVALSGTTTAQRGTIHLLTDTSDSSASVTLAPGSLTEIVPDLNDTDTAQNSQRAQLIATSAADNALRLSTAPALNDVAGLADELDESRIEITTGGTVSFGAGSLISAQAGQIAVSAGAGKIFVAGGAQLDVSGVVGLALPVSDNILTVDIQPTQLRDSPANRDAGTLAGNYVYVDARNLTYVAASTADPTDRYYTPGGLLEVSGFLGDVGHTIGEWSTIGGTITLAAGQVVVQAGAGLTLSGGSVAYQGGLVNASWLLGSNGQIYSVADAPASLTYAGMYAGVTVTDAKWGVTTSYRSPLVGAAQSWDSGYTVGRDAGTLILSTPTAVVEGTINAGVITGALQTADRPASVSDPFTLAQTVAPLGGTLALGNYNATGLAGGYATDVVLGSSAPGIAGGLGPGDAVPAARVQTAWLAADLLNGSGLASLQIATTGRPASLAVGAAEDDLLLTASGPAGAAQVVPPPSLVVAAPLTLAPGGQITLTAPDITVAASVTAPGASVTLSNRAIGGSGFLTDPGTIGLTLPPGADTPVPVTLPAGLFNPAGITLLAGARIDASGMWNNRRLDPNDATGAAFISGGSVTLDSSQFLTLAAGSAIAVSAGGTLSPTGAWQGGKGGSITLAAYDPAGGTIFDAALHDTNASYYCPGPGPCGSFQPNSSGAPVVFDAALTGFGATGAGTLSVTAPLVQIGAVSSAAAGGLALAPGLLPGGVSPCAQETPCDTPSDWAVLVGGSSSTIGGFASYLFNGSGAITCSNPGNCSPATIAAINSPYKVTVAPGTVLDVVAPSYMLAAGAASVATGADPSSAYTVGLAPLFTPNRAKATLTQRGGASLTLKSVDGTEGSGLTIGSGAAITVDPGQAVALTAYNSIVIDGTVTAPGGSIAIVNTRYQDGSNSQLPSLYDPNVAGNVTGLEVWLGAASRLDVSGIAATAADNLGRPFGVVQNGGTISIGGVGGTAGDGTLETTDAQLIIRPGAVLVASGAQAMIDPGAGQLPASGVPVAVAGSGGTIALSSYTGIFPDGTLTAAAGGAGAAGGTLSLTLETAIYNSSKTYPAASLLVPSVLTVAQTAQSLLPAALQEGEATPQTAFARAWIGADQITAGGFGTVNLSSRGLILFDGDVKLAAAQAITFANAILADSAAAAHVNIHAPYVRLGGETSVGLETGDVSGLLQQSWVPPTAIGTSDLLVSADLIDVTNDVRFGTGSKLPLDGSATQSTTYAGFGLVTLDSSGDLRFLAGTGSVSNHTTLLSDADITLKAAQIYPASGAQATVVAGYDFAIGASKTSTANPLQPDGVLSIVRATPELPAAPLSVGGSLTLAGGEVEQDGVVLAPLGNISLGVVTTASALVGFGSANPAVTTRVALGADSLTSVSAAGLTIPYGGTSDGVTYTYGGAAVGSFSPSITLAGRSTSAVPGAVLDLQGGGTLTGGGGELLSNGTLTSQGFIAGRGGSTDVLVTPLLQFDPPSTSSPTATLATNPVYAIVAGFQGGYAPVTPLDTSAGYYGSQPALGEQITIGAGVPGLPAGTYTLLPSYYALLPGGYRVQLAPGHLDQSGAVAAGYGTWELAARLGTANTKLQAALAVPAYITPGTAVLSYSQYDQQSYSAFEIAQAATYDRSRPLLPQDAGTLVLSYPAAPLHNAALDFNGTALFTPGPEGYGGTLEVTAGLTSAIEITGPDGASSAKTVAIDAAALDQFGAPRLVIGGTVTYSSGAAGAATEPSIVLKASAGSVTVDDGATLTAAELFLLASDDGSYASPRFDGGITLATGSVIDTIGRGAPSYDSASTGLAYNVERNTAVLVSNGQISLAPTDLSQRANSGPLTIASGATILSGGSIVATTEQAVSIGDGATFGAAYLTLSVPVVSIGTPAAGVKVPPGLSLDAAVLARLLNGDSATGVPALVGLQITASSAVDFYGTVDFAAGAAGGGLQRLELDTPAIYGQGGPGDVARLAVGTLVWNGVAGSGVTPASVLPQGVVAGGAGTGTGTLDIETTNLVLGYADGVTPTQSLSMDRTILGFSQVTLGASSSIVFNNTGTLSVYAQQSGIGFTGTGGALTLATPVLTGASGASLTITAGGAVTLIPPAGGAASTASQSGQGATLTITAGSVSVGTTLALNAGKIALTATGGDITLGAAAWLDASGPTVTLIDQVVGSQGGTVALESTTGNVVQAAGSVIDVSAGDAAAGTVSVTAGAGQVALNGTLLGGGDSTPDGGSFVLRAGTADFGALNAALDAGGFTAARSFDIATGDIDVTGTIQAHSVSITASGGSLTVSGTIDASGAAPGTIALAAQNALTLTGSAVLDAHATVAQTDSTGAVIAAANRADISLTAAGGLLTLGGGATLNVGNASGTDYGTVELYAARQAGAGQTGGAQNDIAIDAGAAPAILGAASVSLYAMRSYVPDGGVVTQTVLAAANADSTAFIAAAPGNAALMARLAGLSDLAGFHLRPGVAFVSSGTLTVQGDLDLNGMRYASLTGAAATEPGMLLLRAGGTLNIFGSISDGFGAPADSTSKPNPDDNGWVLLKGKEPLGQSVVVPTEVTLAAGTSFDTTSGARLSYPITLAGGTLNGGVLIPTQVTLVGTYKIPAGGWVATSAILNANGQVLFPKGALLPAGTRLDGVTLAAGAVLPFSVHLAAGTVWPPDTSLSLFSSGTVKLSAAATVPAGGLIPAGTDMVFAGGLPSVALRTASGGVQGSVLATAPLDASGQSWSIQLVGGADLASANTGAVQPASVLAAAVAAGNPAAAGNIVLSDLHYVNPGKADTETPGLSVIRTGTGDLSLLAGGSIDVASLYGIYTAGTQSPDVTAGYELPRGTGVGSSNVLATSGTGGYNYNTLLTGYQAWYPTGGGDVLVSAQGSITGDVMAAKSGGSTYYSSDAVGNWLWRQGGSPGQATAWWINFGSYADSTTGSNQLVLVGFSGIGALGGGNVTVVAGGDAGTVATDTASLNTSTALDVVVASTGRVAGDSITLTGGGDVTVSVGGGLNPAGNTLGGVIGSLRGTVSVDAGAIGQIVPSGSALSTGPLIEAVSSASGGPLLLLGDATASLATRGDEVLAGVIDPTRVSVANTTPWTANDPDEPWTATADHRTSETGGGQVYFSLWQPTTAVSLASAGGTLVPTLGVTGGSVGADMNITYPPTLLAVAATGNIVYAGGGAASPALELAPSPVGQLELLAGGSVNAAGLSSAASLGIDISGAPGVLAASCATSPAGCLSNPYLPAFRGTYSLGSGSQYQVSNLTNALDFAGASSLFAFTADTPTGVLHADDTAPARIYAADGDIVDFSFGETWRFVSGSATTAIWYIAAKPALIEASQDIIGGGYASLDPVASSSDAGGLKVTRNLILNDRAGDVSVISAGRDIFYANYDIAGPGTLEVSAGRNLYQADQGSLYSLGQIIGTSSSETGGASILLMAGLAQNPPDWSGFQSLYLGTLSVSGNSVTYDSPDVAGVGYDVFAAQPSTVASVTATTTTIAYAPISPTVKRDAPAAGAATSCVTGLVFCDNHSIPAGPLTVVARGYDTDLVAWMEANFGFVAPTRPASLSAAAWSAEQPVITQAAALAAFQALPLYQRIPFLMQIYFDELAASGLEQTGALTASNPLYTVTSASRLGSLARGHEAHAALEPDPLLASPATTSNSITLYGGSGVTTAFGGNIEAFAPGGQLVLGLASLTPPTPASGQPAAGLITFGSGDVDIATYGSVLLGKSRIFTTFGGAINIWSEGGDINAGTGSETTSVYQPPRIDYDSFGDITLSPSAATTGAGIATLAPVAGVPPGDVVLVVEIGVIDTGEAGIRSTGIASLTGTVVGTGHVTAEGGTYGQGAIAVPNVGALAAAASTSATSTASGSPDDDQRRRKAQNVPAIITVEVVSFGGDTFQ